MCCGLTKVYFPRVQVLNSHQMARGDRWPQLGLNSSWFGGFVLFEAVARRRRSRRSLRRLRSRQELHISFILVSSFAACPLGMLWFWFYLDNQNMMMLLRFLCRCFWIDQVLRRAKHSQPGWSCFGLGSCKQIGQWNHSTKLPDSQFSEEQVEGPVERNDWGDLVNQTDWFGTPEEKAESQMETDRSHASPEHIMYVL